MVIRDLGHGKPPHFCVHLLTTDWAPPGLELGCGDTSSEDTHQSLSLISPDKQTTGHTPTIHQVKPSQTGCCTKPSAAPSTTLFVQRSADSICSTDQGR